MAHFDRGVDRQRCGRFSWMATTCRGCVNERISMGIQPIYGESGWYFKWDWLRLWALQILPGLWAQKFESLSLSSLFQSDTTKKGSKIRIFVSSGSPWITYSKFVPAWAAFLGHDLTMEFCRDPGLGAAEFVGLERAFLGLQEIISSDLAMGQKTSPHVIDDLEYNSDVPMWQI